MTAWGDDFQQDLEAEKSYRCTFCKRGFTNAQALGGHMNIHRKDRAKLKEFSGDNLLSLDIGKSGDCEDSPDQSNSSSASKEKQLITSESDMKELCSDDHKENLTGRLTLFAEPPPPSVEEAAARASSQVGEHAEKRKMEMGFGELDLELRLGPDPPPHQDAKSKPLFGYICWN